MSAGRLSLPGALAELRQGDRPVGGSVVLGDDRAGVLERNLGEVRMPRLHHRPRRRVSTAFRSVDHDDQLGEFGFRHWNLPYALNQAMASLIRTTVSTSPATIQPGCVSQ